MEPPMDRERTRICVGQFAGAHGVRGLVKLKSFTADPASVAAYGPLADESGARRFRLSLTGTVKELWLARVDGIRTREEAQALAGVRLFVDRAALPPPDDEDEFYHADLIGLRAERDDGSLFGTVRAIYDFGAGDVLELTMPDGKLELLPFTRACVPRVEVAAGRILVDPPAVTEARPESDEEDEPEAQEPERGP